MYRFDPGEPIGAELRRVAREQVDGALTDLQLGDIDEAVHEARLRCKRVRSLVRLVEHSPQWKQERGTFRDAGRLLADHRDTAVMAAAAGRLAVEVGDGESAQLVAIGEALARRRTALAESVSTATAAFATVMRQARERVASWTVPDDDVDMLAHGLVRTYRQAAKAMAAAADPTDARLHEWRQRAKDHRYQVQLLEAAWPAGVASHLGSLHVLTDLLGEDHDLALLRRFAGEAGFGQVALIDRRRAALQQQAHALGSRWLSQPADELAERVANTWHQGGRTGHPGGTMKAVAREG